MSKMKKIAAMTAALLICAGNMVYMPESTISIGSFTANAAEVAAEGVKINESYFPDAIFRQYIADNFDKDGDGVLSAEEIANATELNIDACGINNLAGLEYFENLKLLSCSYNNITELDLSQNKELEALYCSENFSIESINVSNNKALKVLYCADNKLTSLDLSNNTALTVLTCFENQLTSLDVSNNSALKRLTTDENEYEIAITDNTFDLSTLPTGFDVSKASEWTNATVEGNILTIEDTSKEVTYKYLYGYGVSETFTLIPQVEETPVETTTAPKATTTTTTAPKTTAMFTTTTFAPPSYSCSLSVYPYDEADTIYEIGEELDYSTICVHGYGGGEDFHADIPYISLNKCGPTVTVDASEFDNTKPGTYTIYVKWHDAVDSFDVTVVESDNAETPAETTTTPAATETTTTVPVTTTPATTTPEEDLPQTGFSNLYNCIPVSAGALVLLGMYAVKKSKKEDEE